MIGRMDVRLVRAGAPAAAAARPWRARPRPRRPTGGTDAAAAAAGHAADAPARAAAPGRAQRPRRSSPARGHRLRGHQPGPDRRPARDLTAPPSAFACWSSEAMGVDFGARLRMGRRLERRRGHEHGQEQRLRLRVPGRPAVRAGEPPARQLPGDPVRRHRVRWHHDGNGAATRRPSAVLRVDVGARAGFELFFGFIGIPELSLNATVGAQFSMRKISTDSSGLTTSDTTPRLLHHRAEQPLGYLCRQRGRAVLFLGAAMKSLFIVWAAVAVRDRRIGLHDRRRRDGHEPDRSVRDRAGADDRNRAVRHERPGHDRGALRPGLRAHQPLCRQQRRPNCALPMRVRLHAELREPSSGPSCECIAAAIIRLQRRVHRAGLRGRVDSGRQRQRLRRRRDSSSPPCGAPRLTPVGGQA